MAATDGVLVAIEGVDGAGKNTLTDRVVKHCDELGLTVARMAFPRYGNSIHADLADAALHSRVDRLADSSATMALLFALDRGSAAAEIAELRRDSDVVILDRYVASNAAYTAARESEGAAGPSVRWIEDLEFRLCSVVQPSGQILVDIPVEYAQERAVLRAQSDSTRPRDRYERDGGLQARTAEIYRELAATSWRTPWLVVDGKAHPDPAVIVRWFQNLTAT